MRASWAIVGFIIGLLYATAFIIFERRDAPVLLEPLKVTIIDDGGAKLKVESTVKPAEKQP